QNAYIRAAGGIAPNLGKNGRVVPVTLDQWRRFNPQIIYGCGLDRQTAGELLSRPGWREVDAMKNGRLLWFPCALTCRASVNAGYFISWLAASIYAEEFSKEENLVKPEQAVGSKPLDIDLEYVEQAQVVKTVLSDFIHKTLVVDFNKPIEILSTLEGFRRDVRAVGNHSLPPPGWKLLGQMNLNRLAEKVCSLIGRNKPETSLLFTGANMDNLTVQTARFRDMTAYALVTAGVKSNAMRMSSDAGNYYEPGTINIIILTNRRLSPRAMARALITVTEAKTAALQDLDVRSGYSPRLHQATGTGTDNLVIVQGEGPPLDLTGGHTKMGELIARTAYAGVKEAIRRQNGLVPERNIFQRLEERRRSLYEPARRACPNNEPATGRLTADLEELLLRPQYASFIKTALALEDAWQRGLVPELKGWRDYCSLVAGQAAGRKIDLQAAWAKTEANPDPGPLDLALQSLCLGLQARSGPE
ncbi:MAG: adenosylcobinamide amidohydrolase, partial [Thermodesulfobacteriota bacterium]|nr:adenosylcobinamide amidohydrolase [Thermodesulfobacteriota bacterium]